MLVIYTYLRGYIIKKPFIGVHLDIGGATDYPYIIDEQVKSQNEQISPQMKVLL